MQRTGLLTCAAALILAASGCGGDGPAGERTGSATSGSGTSASNRVVRDRAIVAQGLLRRADLPTAWGGEQRVPASELPEAGSSSTRGPTPLITAQAGRSFTRGKAFVQSVATVYDTAETAERGFRTAVSDRGRASAVDQARTLLEAKAGQLQATVGDVTATVAPLTGAGDDRAEITTTASLQSGGETLEIHFFTAVRRVGRGLSTVQGNDLGPTLDTAERHRASERAAEHLQAALAGG
ncbi:hypothetical protein [Patulibacter minatonensis]|uniref:hypothetical protein n=1 Tax=Patulibacter minatonensis TaxID=298163 RepID=UPI00047CE0DE|nr:hypothetical protein [Patulibacter minatonensis]